MKIIKNHEKSSKTAAGPPAAPPPRQARPQRRLLRLRAFLLYLLFRTPRLALFCLLLFRLPGRRQRSRPTAFALGRRLGRRGGPTPLRPVLLPVGLLRLGPELAAELLPAARRILGEVVGILQRFEFGGPVQFPVPLHCAPTCTCTENRETSINKVPQICVCNLNCWVFQKIEN